MIIKAAGRTLPLLLEDAGRRFFAALVDPEDVGEALREKISVEGDDPQGLLRAWVEALMDLVKTNGILPKVCRITLKEGSAFRGNAEIVGELLDVQRHQIRPLDTLTRVECQKVGEEFVATVIFAENP